jgi:hypothetical protein
MKKLIAHLLLAGMLFGQVLLAQEAKESDEGMWLPMKLQEINADDMKAKGLELDVTEVYSEDKPSVKDAIVRMGRGFCTGEVISREGLVLTNHHCGYSSIAELSTEENDYLTDGFWAMSNGEELPVPGLTVSFLVHSEDVTQQVNEAENPQAVIGELEEKHSEEGKYEATVKSVYHGSEHYLYVYKTYRDVRFVGAPPSSIGKYGGDTDNWMWPRHTGDFSLFRIYAGSDNEPADYSEDNKPYKPKHFLPVSLAGVEKDDYAMILGYPGSTSRYLTSSAVDLALKQTNGDRIKLMGQRLESMKKAMNADDAVRIELASSYASLANYWKYLIGQSTMLKRYDIVSVKEQQEEAFQKWAEADPDRNKKYGEVLAQIDELHKGYESADRFISYLNFGVFGVSAMTDGIGYYRLLRGLGDDPEDKKDDKEAQAKLEETLPEAREKLETDWETFYADMDKEVMVKTLLAFYEGIPESQHPEEVANILSHKQAKKGATTADKFRMWTDWAYENSFITNEAMAQEFFEKPSLKTLKADPFVKLVQSTLKVYQGAIQRDAGQFQFQIEGLRKTYIQGMREMNPDKMFYPDANSTMRVTYGKVVPYIPKDGVFYDYKTTLDGVMEKEDPTNDEFIVPSKLKELWEDKDYGRYAEDGDLPVNFLSTTDITGGNSGSPVINGRGELIGCAFDGNWEAMASDIYVFPDVTRTISVDSRYILFIIDKFAGASHLLDEMEIVGEKD